MNFTKRIADKLGIPESKVSKVLDLSGQGNTIPFIARYRKEATGSLDEVQIGDILTENKRLIDLEARKLSILESIKEQGKLTPELERKILECFDTNKLEDLYLPYKKKRKTKADMARELGLEPLAKMIMAQNAQDIYHAAKQYTNKDIGDSDAAIAMALDIVKEWIAENDTFRERFRETYRRYGEIASKVVKSKKDAAATYRDYFDFSEKLDRCPSHRYLAMMRGESEGFLRVKLNIDDDRAIEFIEGRYLKRNGSNPELIAEACKGAYKDYISPGVENQIRKEYKEQADEEAIKVFAKNLEQLLLAAPLGTKAVLAIDPGFRTGCKVACLDENGTFLKDAVIYPHEPQLKKTEAEGIIRKLVDDYNVKAIAIGNGTASRETKSWIDSISGMNSVESYVISESGASIYSASDVAREEFPNLDLTVRGAISLGRRLLDPLSELVKVDAKSIGVGQYQHDVNQTRLKESLDQSVISCVNRVGIDLNTTGYHLLSYISGLGPTIAKNIISYRSELGGFTDKNQLKAVPRLGDKAFEQSAGFLRIREADNPLDNTGIHPESYHFVDQIAEDLGKPVEEIIGDGSLVSKINKSKLINAQFGAETLKDILSELAKPGHDLRGVAQVFEFDKNVKSMADLKVGMKLPGIVSNITNFGAFVNVGVKQDGLVHISQISGKRINSPMDVLSLDQKVWVKVLEVDIARNRINLSMKN